MSASDPLVGVIYVSGAKIVHGEDRVLTLQINDEGAGNHTLGTPSEITAKFKKTDNSILSKTLTSTAVAIVDDPGGRITVTLSAADTASLKVGDSQTFEVAILKSAQTRIVQFYRALSVCASVTE